MARLAVIRHVMPVIKAAVPLSLFRSNARERLVIAASGKWRGESGAEFLFKTAAGVTLLTLPGVAELIEFGPFTRGVSLGTWVGYGEDLYFEVTTPGVLQSYFEIETWLEA